MSNQHRFKLKPYKTPADRSACPDCGKNKVFAPYIDTHTDSLLPDEYGRCNRESNCGYHLNPYNDGYSKMIIESEKANGTTPKFQGRHIAKPTPKTSVNIPVEVLKESLTGFEQNRFIQFLLRLFPEEVVNALIEDYYIGTSSRWEGATVFWFINGKGQIRAGQIKQFSSDGHTNKYRGKDGEEKKCTSWVDAYLSYQLRKQRAELPEWLTSYKDQPIRVDCLYGEHRLTIDIFKPIALFESPKAAIIATPYFPDFICMATGSLSYFTEDRIKVLKGRKVVLFPDLSKGGNAFKMWSDRAKEFAHIATFQVSDLLENEASDKEKADGLDLADFLARINYQDYKQSILSKEEKPTANPEPKPFHTQTIPEVTPNAPEYSKCETSTSENSRSIFNALLDDLDKGKPWELIYRQRKTELPADLTPDTLKSFFHTLGKKHLTGLSHREKFDFIQARSSSVGYTLYGIIESFPFLGFSREYEVSKLLQRYQGKVFSQLDSMSE